MNYDKAIEKLNDINLPINDVRAIFDIFKDSNEIVGMVAMNISRKCSVYDKEQGKSAEIVELLVELSESDDMGSRWAVAKNHFTPVDILEKLSKDSINLVRALVATNPNTPTHILNKLFSDEKIVRDGLSGNPNTPLKLLNVLAGDNDKMVRLRVAENPSVSTEILESLLDDGEPNVAKAAEVKLGEKNEA
ncbi:MAG: hypothetical protein PHI79_03820 [Sulfurovaceae bacterium]|nr:hypothetical protein [Sulfurovaceae bacterium]MDD5548710.1 hypothetical protein [Sulfurovaceae bacterium]